MAPDGPGGARAGFLADRVVHLHASRRCNLACRHCYSTSSPRQARELPADRLETALATLWAHGFRRLSLSGGEPLLHPEVGRIVATARGTGFRVSIVTNGLLADRLARLLPALDVVAVSLDGARDVHDRVRARRGAFDRAVHTLQTVRARAPALSLAIAFAVGPESLRDVPEVHRLARAIGVDTLQLRPVALVGRAQGRAAEFALDAADRWRLMLLAGILDGQTPRVHVDLLPASWVGGLQAYHPVLRTGSAAWLSDLVNPVVIEDTGALVPFTYGFSRHLAIGSVLGDVEGEVERFCRERGADVAEVLWRSRDGALARGDEPVDWFELVSVAGHELEAERLATA